MRSVISKELTTLSLAPLRHWDRLTPERRRRFYQLLSQGLTDGALAKEFKVSPTTVAAWVELAEGLLKEARVAAAERAEGAARDSLLIDIRAAQAAISRQMATEDEKPAASRDYATIVPILDSNRENHELLMRHDRLVGAEHELDQRRRYPAELGSGQATGAGGQNIIVALGFPKIEPGTQPPPRMVTQAQPTDSAEDRYSQGQDPES